MLDERSGEILRCTWSLDVNTQANPDQKALLFQQRQQGAGVNEMAEYLELIIYPFIHY